ncbi:N-acetylornithine carbamoyltransferase [Chondromyces apiculatus]|uniref:N-acetylornithine carbamoyltransferase n=1 Tax=Chondromyces apiculatus DSM 436 TaxID=1192034 RepID=A0A017SVA4_9BACT|nr:N-acetylornithine carbamoyltransferase [Chondromyces apiculatus]EYF00687.1 N-acetylornithine carbamoyltransferase [Chondromyces apiculatus DSM 436]
MRHFLTTLDYSRDELQGLLDVAARMKAGRHDKTLEGKSIALLFFNPSLRTRTSFELGAHQLGMKAIVLEPGKGAWPIEFEDGGVMDGEPEEHVREVARVLSRYVDAIAVRAFPKFQRWEDDREDKVIRAFAAHATVPVINMETITHPCQELALMLTLQEKLGRTDGKKLLLTWTYHPKPLNTAVANSALIIAAKFGFEVTLLCPTPEYVLDRRYMDAAEEMAQAAGQRITVTHDVEAGYRGAAVVYAKSWGALPYFGRWAEEKPIREAHRHFMVDRQKMELTSGGLFSHCLPVRRNVKVTDEVLDSPQAIHIDEAENRIHVQKALMEALLAGASAGADRAK